MRQGNANDPFHLADGFEAVITYEYQEWSNHPFSHSYNADKVVQCRQVGAGNMERYNQFIEASRSSLGVVLGDLVDVAPSPPRSLTGLPHLRLVTCDLCCDCNCAVTVSSTGAENRFKGMTTATSGVLARFALLLPLRNSCELRGLCRHSYFGPRTFGGGGTKVIEVGGFSIRVSPSHP